MKIETKYNIGDEVYAVNMPNDSYKYAPTKIKIAEIKVRANSDFVFIDYNGGKWNRYDDVQQDDCYPTLAECQVECDRLNGEVK